MATVSTESGEAAWERTREWVSRQGIGFISDDDCIRVMMDPGAPEAGHADLNISDLIDVALGLQADASGNFGDVHHEPDSIVIDDDAKQRFRTAMDVEWDVNPDDDDEFRFADGDGNIEYVDVGALMAQVLAAVGVPKDTAVDRAEATRRLHEWLCSWDVYVSGGCSTLMQRSSLHPGHQSVGVSRMVDVVLGRERREASSQQLSAGPCELDQDQTLTEDEMREISEALKACGSAALAAKIDLRRFSGVG